MPGLAGVICRSRIVVMAVGSPPPRQRLLLLERVTDEEAHLYSTHALTKRLPSYLGRSEAPSILA